MNELKWTRNKKVKLTIKAKWEKNEYTYMQNQ